VIVLMSDGHANKPNGNGPGYAREMAHYAAGLNIKVYTISLGNAADEDLMEDIAEITGAKHFTAGGSSSELPDKLKDAFRNVASDVKRTQLVK
jgi:Mg-chelatase subunit ChlD